MDLPDSFWVTCLSLIILLFIHGLFAASEIAFVSLNQERMEQLAERGNRRAQRVLRLRQDAESLLTTIQVVITLAGFLASALGAARLLPWLLPVVPAFPGKKPIIFIVVTVILAYLTLVFGEFFPKSLAQQRPEKTAMATSGLVLLTKQLFTPFNGLLALTTRLLERLTPVDFKEKTRKFTREEMSAIIRESRQEGSIDLDEYSMLQGVLSLDDVMGREVMVPRIDAVMIDVNDDYNTIMDELLTTTYSRIPLYEDDKDNVIGILHIKQLLAGAREHHFQGIDLKALASPPLFVPSTIYIDDLLIEFRREQQHMAILKDEYGGVEGLVTMEDVLEEIVGEIDDESDLTPSEEIVQIAPDHYRLNGLLSIDKFNDIFNQHIEAEDVDTMAGLIIYQIGYMPADGEEISLRANDWVLKTSEIDKGRIREIDLFKDPQQEMRAHYDLALKPETEEHSPANEEE